ncbi:MAG: SulP family inorganic anion transporter [Proteobacteria bacterium]|nr:SulP family inorganic anion transporter [Pseudomonadota bacterium]
MTEEGTGPGAPTVTGELLAGLSVAVILAPQAMAYAVLAGLPPWHGLYAAAVAPIAAAPLASSRYLQTGPVALTSLLTVGALGTMAATGSAEYVGLAAVLAVVVGVVRLAIGLFKAGRIAELMTPPVLQGFMIGAAVLILASQIPSALGVTDVEGRLLARAAAAASEPGSWVPVAVALSVATVLLVRLGKLLHPLFPGVLVAAAGGVALAWAGAPVGPTVGALPETTLALRLDLPWASTAQLILPGIVIALVGFAEAAAISKVFADADGEDWDVDREFTSQGAANVAAGLFGGFPTGGSFSRSALDREAGGVTRWSGLIAGVAILAFLPLAGMFEVLPLAVMGGIIIAAVVKLLDPRPLLRNASERRLDVSVGLLTLGLTLSLAPRLDLAVLGGVAAAALSRLLSADVRGHDSDTG